MNEYHYHYQILNHDYSIPIPISFIAAPVILFDRLLLTSLLLSRGHARESSVRDILILIYNRTAPSVEVLCELCKLVPELCLNVLREVVKE